MDLVSPLIISRFLSYSVILLSFCMKFPQIQAIFYSKSSKGVNVRGYWMEIGSYLIGASYGYFHGFHISTYGEAILLAIQSTVIILAVVYYGNLWTLENAAYLIVTVGFCVGSIIKIFPSEILYFLLLCTLPLSAFSKIIQIIEVYKIKSQGDVSVLMWGLAGYGCAARLFTIVVEVKDIQVFLNFLIAFILNTTVVGLCLYYGKGVHKEKKLT